MASELESLHIESESSLASLETLASLASSDRLLDELKLRELTISQLRGRVLQLERARLDKIPLDPAREISRLQSSVVSPQRKRDTRSHSDEEHMCCQRKMVTVLPM